MLSAEALLEKPRPCVQICALSPKQAPFLRFHGRLPVTPTGLSSCWCSTDSDGEIWPILAGCVIKLQVAPPGTDL